jgi:quercetin dioxygenase-like cupin family protein
MKAFVSAVPAIMMAASAALAQEDTSVVVSRAGSVPSTQGSAENFTGSVRVDSRFQRAEPARLGGGVVTFEPGARTAWHTHPLGQTLIVTSGVGLVQHWDGPIQEIRPGDVVWIPPHTKHWHGARQDVGMSHIALAETRDGKAVEWMEHVSDQQYQGK